MAIYYLDIYFNSVVLLPCRNAVHDIAESTHGTVDKADTPTWGVDTLPSQNVQAHKIKIRFFIMII